ncbi:serine/threonine protein kinase [Fusarium verticillioides 7600]|uniref:Serine/threonine protein kinase n=1 Tax=Gibberella moniliformis (strain M3125 / FGSC 7600) TaxID=334819 RepID=W7LB54_GIBM7|nr:serine/threonine protein kinase [Fusarium verticillioides 7600]EWG35871.1 serine/threonine protein kinase [Fusarium verticillioides 7600]
MPPSCFDLSSLNIYHPITDPQNEMDSSSGRNLTSFRGETSDPTTFKPYDPETLDDARFIPNALDFAYRAFLADNAVTLSVPPAFSNAQAVDSASYAGRGASFTVYRRRIPPQKLLTSVTNMDGLLIEIKDKRKLPEVVAYKVAVIEFSDKGEATQTSRHAIDAAIMELYLSTHRPILQHPNLVDFLGLAWGANPFNSSQKLPVLMVEFAEHGSLSQLQQREYLGIETRRKLCLDVCKGLHMLHSCGIVHGDIKAPNVLIFPDTEHKYRAKVNDFGYSQVINTERSSLLLGGTRPWKAPEAKTAVTVSDAKYTDIYSLSLFIWCTFAHGQNIFKLLVDPSKQGEEFFAEAEKLKVSQELAAQTDISAWYMKAIMATTYGDTGQFLQRFQSLQQQLQQNNTQANHPAVGIDDIEKILCAIPPALFQAMEPLKQQLIATVESLGSYEAMKRAVTIGLSNEPHQRDLEQIMVALGHSGSFTQDSAEQNQVLKSNLNQHFFTWRHWTKMDPSVQRYLTTTYIQRGEGEVKKGMINPPEAFLLTALYINGYGVDKDTSQALRWLFNAWGVKHPLASAYGYRIAQAIGHTPDNLESVIETLELMALRGSRTALQDLAMLSKSTYEKTKKTIRDVLAGTGANFFFKTEMLHGFAHNMWIRTFENIPILLENFSQLDSIADYTANKRGDRILHVAASCGQTEAIGALLNHFPSLEVNQLNGQGETPLLCACRAGQYDTVLWLASNGATASVARNGESPLHWLISFNDEEIESVGPALIQAGADVNAKTSTFIAYQAGFPASLDIDRLPEGHPIGWATQCDRPKIVKFLLSHTADPRMCNTSWPQARSALEIAASQLRSECLELMIHAIEQFNLEQGAEKRGGFFVTGLLQQAVYGSSLFDMILYHGPRYQQAMESTFQCLLPRTSRLVSPQGYGGFNQTLLYLAISLARDELVEYLLKHGADVIKTGENYDEEVLQSQDVGAFKTADINRACGVDLRTPLLEAVRWNRPTMVNLLLEHGAHATGASKNPFSGQDSTWTALHVLAYAGQNDTRLVQPLLDHGAPLDGFPDEPGRTESPLLVAVQNDQFQLAECFVSHGADINFTSMSSGHLSFTNPTTILGHVIASNARNSIARLRYLLDSGDCLDFIVERTRQWTALHRAAAAHIDAEFRGTDATEAAELDWTDIDWSANREIVNELLLRFSDPAQLDAVEKSMGLTAMHLAVLAGNDAAVKLLLDKGARGDMPSAGGQGPTAADMALGIQMERLSVSEEGARPGEEEVAARKRCSDLLNPLAQPLA